MDKVNFRKMKGLGVRRTIRYGRILEKTAKETFFERVRGYEDAS